MAPVDDRQYAPPERALGRYHDDAPQMIEWKFGGRYLPRSRVGELYGNRDRAEVSGHERCVEIIR